MRFVLLWAVLLATLLCTVSSAATYWGDSDVANCMLYKTFGVLLDVGSTTLTDTKGTTHNVTDAFVNDWAPTTSIGGSWAVDNWYGSPSTAPGLPGAANDWNSQTGAWEAFHYENLDSTHSTNNSAYHRPEGEEPYDVEAMYLGLDPDYLYVSIVTSFPQPSGYGESRIDMYDSFYIASGDLAIHLKGKDYAYGVDINLADTMDNIGTSISDGVGEPKQSMLGDKVYKTVLDTDPGQLGYPYIAGDWYVSAGLNYAAEDGGTTEQGNLLYTNFEGASLPTGQYQGTADVEYYRLTKNGDVLVENGYGVYQIGVRIPLSLLPDFTALSGTEDWIGVHWTSGCRNDAAEYSLRVSHDVPEPGTFALMGLGLAGLGFLRRRRKSA